MQKNLIILNTKEYIQSHLQGDSSGHDWWHTYRVWSMAKRLAQEENANLFVVELAALLHDIADWKFHNGDNDVGPRRAREWLEKLDVDEDTITHVCSIIRGLSFKGAGVETPMESKEGMIVQDADRLDAIGAIDLCIWWA